MLDAIFKPFVEQSPICVMAVAAARRLLGNERLDRLFAQARVGQYVRELMFSDLFDLMAAVVSGSRKSVYHAYQGSSLGVSVVAVYDKLKGIEPSVCRALVRETAAEVATLMAEMDATPGRAGRRVPVLPGYHTKVLDGHAQERAILPQVYPTVAAGDLWVADRNFCTAEFLAELSARGACFVIRRHGNMACRPTGDRVRVGRCDTGTVYEQPVVITTPDGGELPLRMAEVELDKPARGGDRVLTLLTNLPPSVDAITVADLYRGRWEP